MTERKGLPTPVADLAGLIGQEIGVSRWITVDQARIDAFAEITEDRQFIHIDPVAAAHDIRTTVRGGRGGGGAWGVCVIRPSCSLCFPTPSLGGLGKAGQHLRRRADKTNTLPPPPPVALSATLIEELWCLVLDIVEGVLDLLPPGLQPRRQLPDLVAGFQAVEAGQDGGHGVVGHGNVSPSVGRVGEAGGWA